MPTYFICLRGESNVIAREKGILIKKGVLCMKKLRAKVVSSVIATAVVVSLSACAADDEIVVNYETIDVPASVIASEGSLNYSSDIENIDIGSGKDSDSSSKAVESKSSDNNKGNSSKASSSKVTNSKTTSSKVTTSKVTSSKQGNSSKKENSSTTSKNTSSKKKDNSSRNVESFSESSSAVTSSESYSNTTTESEYPEPTYKPGTGDYSSVQVDTTSDGPADPSEWYEDHGVDPDTNYEEPVEDTSLLDRDSFPDDVKPYVYPYDPEGIRQDMIDYAVQTYGLVLDESITLFDSTWSEGPDSEAWHAKRDPEYFRAACLEDVDYAMETLCMYEEEEDTSWLSKVHFNIIVNPMVSGIEGGCYIGIDQFPDEVVVYVATR